MIKMDKEKFKKIFGGSKILSSYRDGSGFNITLRGEKLSKTQIRIANSLNPESKEYCVITNKQLGLPVYCEKDKNLPSAVRKFLKENDIEDPEKFFLKENIKRVRQKKK